MRYELTIALRYLLAKRREKFISIISLISVLGVAVGVCALIVVIGVMTGFDNELRDSIIGANSHLIVEQEGGIDDAAALIKKIRTQPHVVSAAPFLDGQAFIKAKDTMQGVSVRGIVADEEVKVSKIGSYMKAGSIEAIRNNGMLIGTELARKFSLKLGDTVSAMSPMDAREKNFRVAGIFSSGYYDYDSGLVLIDLKSAQDLFDFEGKTGGVGIKIDNEYLAPEIRIKLQKELGFPFYVKTWIDLNRNLFSALKLEKLAMFWILALIVMVACFNIAATLIMVVMEKTKDIGILKAIGATNNSIMTIFTLQGFIIGAVGTALGTVGGLGLGSLLEKYQFIKLPRDIYYWIEKFPVDVQLGDVSAIVAAALLISLLACVYPAWQASRLNPVDALRYE